MTSDENKVLGTLQNLCVRKEYCSSDIFLKALKSLEGDRDAAGRVLESLVNDRFVDDLRYAGAFARDKAHLDGWGPVKIRFQLSGKGIPSSVISQALESVDPDKSLDRLRGILEAKYRTVKGEPDERLRLLKFALSRGYEYETVSGLVNEIISSQAI